MAELRAKALGGLMDAKRASASRWRFTLWAVLSYSWPLNVFSSCSSDFGELCSMRLPRTGACRRHCLWKGLALRLRSSVEEGQINLIDIWANKNYVGGGRGTGSFTF